MPPKLRDQYRDQGQPPLQFHYYSISHQNHHHQHPVHQQQTFPLYESVQHVDNLANHNNSHFPSQSTSNPTSTSAAAVSPPVRSNEELNLAVLRRHDPSVTSILSLAPYAVVYLFSPSSHQWEKSGVEGSLFVTQRTQGPLGEERYGVFVLNRRGLNNFDLPLTHGDNVEVTEEYVILKTDDDNTSSPPQPAATAASAVAGGSSSGTGGIPLDGGDRNGPAGAGPRIVGLWIYSEPPPNSTAETRAINARVIKECAVHAGQSLQMAQERRTAETRQAAAARPEAPPSADPAAVPMYRQISLKELFGQQRAQDDAWSVKIHSPAAEEPPTLASGVWSQPPPPLPQSTPSSRLPGTDVLADLFHRAGLTYRS
jgi:hypothetical protein